MNKAKKAYDLPTKLVVSGCNFFFAALNDAINQVGGAEA